MSSTSCRTQSKFPSPSPKANNPTNRPYREPYMDLPPSNSFCRMLTHKLADYYHMTHSFEHHIGSVRIFRTPFCRVPPSLATMIPQTTVSTSSTPPPVVLPRKIMRRGQEDEGGSGSAGASKTTSENGSDSKDKQPLVSQKYVIVFKYRMRQVINLLLGCHEKSEKRCTSSLDSEFSETLKRHHLVSAAVKAWITRNSAANSFHQKQMVNMEYPEQALYPPTIGLLPVKRQSLPNGAMTQMVLTLGANTRLIGGLNNRHGCLSHLISSSLPRMDSSPHSQVPRTLLKWPLRTVSSLLAILRRKEWHQMRHIQLRLRYVMHFVGFTQDKFL